MAYEYKKARVEIPHTGAELYNMWRESGLSQIRFAERHGWSQQAVNAKIRRYLKESRNDGLLPWVLKDAHGHKSPFAVLARAYVKWRRGEAKPEEVEDGRQFERYCRDNDSVMVYLPEEGFYFRSRRVTDDPESCLAVDTVAPSSRVS